MFCFTELSVFISALIQMRQANLIQMEIHFLAVMVHRIEKLIKTRKKKGEERRPIHSMLVTSPRLLVAEKLSNRIYLLLPSS